MDAGPDSTTVDGRSRRRQRNRDAVLDAVIDIFHEGDIDPAVESIAERAYVSTRSIYRYFDHRDHLIRAAVNHAVERAASEIAFDVGVGSFEDRVDAFVDQRLRVYRRLAPITRAAELAAVSEPIIAEELDVDRRRLHQSFLDHFAEEFETLPPGERTRAVIGAELALQFDAFEFLSAATDGRIGEMRAILVDQLRLNIGRLRTTSTA